MMKELKLDIVVDITDYSFFLILYCIALLVCIEEYFFPLWELRSAYRYRPLLVHFYEITVFAFKLIVLSKSFGCKFVIPSQPSTFLRKKPTKDVLQTFVSNCKIQFIGVTKWVVQNTKAVLHPIDYFIDNLYRVYNDKSRLASFDTYKRTNPTLKLKLDQLDKYGSDYVMDDVTFRTLKHISHDILNDVLDDVKFQSLRKELVTYTGGMFPLLEIDKSSAAGYPYDPGVKRRDVYDEAIECSYALLNNDSKFDAYMNEHVWYTTGRAKLQEVTKDDSARLICYSGFCSMLISMLYFQPWCRFMNTRFEWCAVGMSWMNKGAMKLANFFNDTEGKSPDGFKYCVIDIKGWDSSLNSQLMGICKDFHVDLMTFSGVDCSFLYRFKKIFHDMIYAKIVMPMGYTFRSISGMKSGWANTANDNTLIHEIVFRYIENKVGVRMKHKLYGDDNIFLLPDSIDIDQIIKGYLDCGITVGRCTVSKDLFDVDFLSKRIKFENGEYYVYRDSVETHSRLLMPEEMDPSRRIVPDERIAAERIIGHLFDNPFNADVRHTCYSMLKHIRKNYGVKHIEMDPDKLKKAPWRFMDHSRISGVIPTVPDFDFIKELYGVSSVPTSIVWPSFDFDPIRYSLDKVDDDMNRFSSACLFYKNTIDELYGLMQSRRKLVAKKTSPFLPPKNARGFHGGRFEYAVQYFQLEYNSVLDFGSHPGAAAFSASKDPDISVTCVSLIPEQDRKRPMPYVLKKDNVTFIEQDVNDFVPFVSYDLVHDDVDVVGGRDEDTDFDLALQALGRFRKFHKKFKQCVTTLHDVNHDVIDALYETYLKFGFFDIVKPLYSNPWKPQFVVLFKKSSNPLMRKHHFVRSLYHYFNSHSVSIITWCDVFNVNIGKASFGKDVEVCPFQKNEDFQYRCNSMLF